jgi:hypothetical protein
MTSKKIKLSQVRKQDYTELAVAMNKLLREKPITLSLNLGELFVGHDYSVPIAIVPTAEPVIDTKYGADYYELGFGIRLAKEDKKRITSIARQCSLKNEVIEDWIRRAGKRKDLKDTFDAQEFLESLLRHFETDRSLCQSLVGHYYDIRYHPETNRVYATDLYSGKLRGQGLLTNVFKSIGEIVDFNDLDYLQIDEIVEKNTIDTFESIILKTKDPIEICEAFKTEYQKSPFLRLFYGLGFLDMELRTYGDKKDKDAIYLGSIAGRKSPDLRFSMHKED